MTKDAALTLALEALKQIDEAMPFPVAKLAQKAIKEALAQPEQDDRRLQIAMRQWEDWKIYALELQKKLVKYEGGSPMILNTQPEQEPVGFAVMERPWVGLTDEEQIQVAWSCGAMSADWLGFANSIEAKLKEKNT